MNFAIEFRMELLFLICSCYEVYCFSSLVILSLRQVKLRGLRYEIYSDCRYRCEDSSENIDRDPIRRDEHVVKHGIYCNKAIIELQNCSHECLSIRWKKFLHKKIRNGASANTTGSKNENESRCKDPVSRDENSNECHKLN